LNWLILDVQVRRPNQAWQWPDWIMLSRSDRQQLTRLLRHAPAPVWPAEQEVMRVFEQMERLLREPKFPQSRLALLVNECLLALLEHLQAAKPALDEHLSSTEHTVALLLQSVAEHPERPWTLDEMAEACGLGRTRFVHHCKRLTNLSPNDYLNRSRVQRAEQLLGQSEAVQTHPSITEIAGRCGFSSSQYFATVFKRLTGIAPREYRRQHA